MQKLILENAESQRCFALTLHLATTLSWPSTPRTGTYLHNSTLTKAEQKSCFQKAAPGAGVRSMQRTEFGHELATRRKLGIRLPRLRTTFDCNS
jgi:hypothetical protein